MRTYQIESVISEHGIIVLPYEMKNLQKHRVKLIITDLEAEYTDPVDFLDYVTDKYSDINENDLNLSKIYRR
jgi:hypothetical protein